MAVMGLGVRRAGCQELCGGKWLQSCVMGRGREGGYMTAPTAGILLPSLPAWEASREQKPCLNHQHSEISPKLTRQKGSD